MEGPSAIEILEAMGRELRENKITARWRSRENITEAPADNWAKSSIQIKEIKVNPSDEISMTNYLFCIFILIGI